MSEELFNEWKNGAINKKSENRKFLKSLKKKDRKEIDGLAEDINEEVFEDIDCLKCANCCKTISPIVRNADVRRMASHLKMKESKLIEEYLLIDEDEDFVMNSAPCPFLGSDNYCSIYEARPKACREYPHINHKPFTSINNLHKVNSLTCPAVYHALERMKKLI